MDLYFRVVVLYNAIMIEKSDKRLQTTVFRLPTEIHKALRQTALEQGISMGEALRQAVEVWLKEHKKTKKGVKK